MQTKARGNKTQPLYKWNKNFYENYKHFLVVVDLSRHLNAFI